METHSNKLTVVVKEDGVADLRNLPGTGLKCCVAFAKALIAERNAGGTDEAAMAFLEEAVALEAAAA